MQPTRRRFLTLASAACLAAPAALAYQWTGTALGARVRIILDRADGAAVAARARAEIDRLEDVFSLYRPGSDLSRLNAAGRLDTPPFELLECLSVARRVHRALGGRFDPTVQPLWRTLATALGAGQRPDPDALAAARAAIGFDRVRFDPGAVRLGSGQALTLNGIAQGYIADRVAAGMRRDGVADVLIDTGEIVAMGDAPDRAGDGWPVTIAGTAGPMPLRDRALATSAPLGTRLDAAGTVGHILDPRAGAPRPPKVAQITVSAASAALADAASTGLCLAEDRAEIDSLLRNLGGVTLEHLRLTHP